MLFKTTNRSGGRTAKTSGQLAGLKRARKDCSMAMNFLLSVRGKEYSDHSANFANAKLLPSPRSCVGKNFAMAEIKVA